MAEVIKIIDPDQGAGHDYHSLTDWEAAQQGDLTSGARDGEIAVAKCRSTGGTADTTAVVLDGWTTDADGYIKIWCDPAESYRHAGVYSASKYRLEEADERCINVGANRVWIDGLQIIKSTGTANYLAPVVMAGSGTLWLSNCLMKQGGSTYREPIVYINDPAAAAVVKIWNCVGYGCGSSTHAYSSGVALVNCSTVEVYNSTFIGGTYGVNRVAGTVTCKNTYGCGNTAGFNGTITTSYCASNTTELSGTGDIDSVAKDTDTFVNVTGGSENFHLAADGNSPLEDQGNAPGRGCNGDAADHDRCCLPRCGFRLDSR